MGAPHSLASRGGRPLQGTGATLGAGDRRAEELCAELAPLLRDAGFEAVELHLVPRRRDLLIRIFVDTLADDPEVRVTHGDCVRVTRAVADFLDAGERIEGPYLLEVSSPGLERPLTEARHFRRNRGRLVEVTGRGQDDRTYVRTGRLLEVLGEELRLEVAGGEVLEVPLAEIERARVVPEFRRPARADARHENS